LSQDAATGLEFARRLAGERDHALRGSGAGSMVIDDNCTSSSAAET
jgi:hypothetical protein